MNIIERIRFVGHFMMAMFDKIMADVELEKKKKLSARRPRAEDPDG